MSTRREFLLHTTAGITAAAGVSLAQAQAKKDSAVSAPKNPLKTYKIAKTDLVVSRIAYGWGQLGGQWGAPSTTAEERVKAELAVRAAFDNGITLFDHADIYSYGKSETVFGEILRRAPGMRDRIVLQTKCGIRLTAQPQDPPPDDISYFDFGYDRIVSSVEGSLKRFGADRIDLLLLHRPDALVEPEEVARAFDELHRSGKVRYFGVSNHTGAQIELLKRYVRQPLVSNQIQLGLMHPYLITEGLDFNRQDKRRFTQGYASVDSTLEYCRQHDILVQAYSPVRGLSSRAAQSSPAAQKTMQMLQDLAAKKGSSPFALALAWLLRHPAGIAPISGADNPEHIAENCSADRVTLERKEWYALLYAATGVEPMQML